jgi:hypothetical protein
MKKLLLPAAFAFAVVSALAFKPTTTLYKVNPDPLSPNRCIQTTECTIPNLTNCSVQIYQSVDGAGDCENPVNFGRL